MTFGFGFSVGFKDLYQIFTRINVRFGVIASEVNRHNGVLAPVRFRIVLHAVVVDGKDFANVLSVALQNRYVSVALLSQAQALLPPTVQPGLGLVGVCEHIQGNVLQPSTIEGHGSIDTCIAWS